MSPTGTPPGLAWPGPDTGPVPPPEYKGKGDERLTRKPIPTWDRSKFLVVLGLVWVILFWATVVDNPIIPVADAFNQAIEDRWWLLVLILLESARQLHYVVSEHSAAYHQFWTKKVFGSLEKRIGRLNDWNRFRMARALKYLGLLAIVAIILGAANKQSPILALFELPGTIWAAMPFVLQMAFSMMFLILQFAALFWFMSRGGVDTYFPDDIKTRFTDVWGQDAVVERVKENMLFLEDPESIEAKGGYVPGGLLLWGPPGTGKTLMAEAVAGETGRPYVFVDPGAFEGMFIGRRHHEGQGPVPQAAQAGRALRRGDRVLRRGRLPRQPAPVQRRAGQRGHGLRRNGTRDIAVDHPPRRVQRDVVPVPGHRLDALPPVAVELDDRRELGPREPPPAP